MLLYRSNAAWRIVFCCSLNIFLRVAGFVSAACCARTKRELAPDALGGGGGGDGVEPEEEPPEEEGTGAREAACLLRVTAIQ